MNPYSAEFYRTQANGSARSAARAIPELLKWISPRSVVDVGCGVGTWLREFQSHGVEDILGIDGDYVDRALLAIDPAHFKVQELSGRVSIERAFDLAISLEVGEHLPAHRALSFVEDLCRLAPLVAFSAAIPGQGGTHHVNEQWQSYWAALFERCGYQALDVLRPALWKDAEVEFWYAQNMLLYASREALRTNSALAAMGVCALLDIVHPSLFAAVSAQPAIPPRMKKLLRLAGIRAGI